MNRKEVVYIILIILVIWAAITILWWSFGTKTDMNTTCEKVCYTTLNQSTKIMGGNGTYHTYAWQYQIPISCLSEDNPAVKNETFCYHTWSHERRITLVEVLQDQTTGARESLSGFAAWVSAHKVGVFGV